MDRTEKEKYYTRLIEATLPDAEVKGSEILYTSMNGNMYTQLTKEGDVGIRLPAALREELMEKYNTAPIISYGVLMKEYVKIPDHKLSDISALISYLKASYEYAKTLKSH